MLNTKPAKSFETGIALSGGGTRGYAHLGVLQALNEKNIYPDVISGVSAGAIIGALIASGKTPVQVMRLMRDHKLLDFTSIQIPKMGLLSLNKLGNFLKKQLPDDTFESLEIPLYVTVSNLSKGRMVYCNTGSLSQLVTASASIPVLFSPVKINGEYYADGGIFDNLPVQPLLDSCKHIIGINISPVKEAEKLANIIQVAARTFQLNARSTIERSIQKCDVFIEPPDLCDFDLLDTSSAQQLFDIGYQHTMKLEIKL